MKKAPFPITYRPCQKEFQVFEKTCRFYISSRKNRNHLEAFSFRAWQRTYICLFESFCCNFIAVWDAYASGSRHIDILCSISNASKASKYKCSCICNKKNRCPEPPSTRIHRWRFANFLAHFSFIYTIPQLSLWVREGARGICICDLTLPW